MEAVVMMDAVRMYLARVDWARIVRTLAQVLGGVVVAFLLDWGEDGVVVVRDYIFGQGGIIIVATVALAGLMNLPSRHYVPGDAPEDVV